MDTQTTAPEQGEPQTEQDNLTLALSALELCRKHAAGKRGVTGSIRCPKCGGILNYSVTSTQDTSADTAKLPLACPGCNDNYTSRPDTRQG